MLVNHFISNRILETAHSLLQLRSPYPTFLIEPCISSQLIPPPYELYIGDRIENCFPFKAALPKRQRHTRSILFKLFFSILHRASFSRPLRSVAGVSLAAAAATVQQNPSTPSKAISSSLRNTSLRTSQAGRGMHSKVVSEYLSYILCYATLEHRLICVAVIG